jgi:hypothetical protein
MTNNMESLLQHLNNLQQQGAKKATFDVKWLLDVLEKSSSGSQKLFANKPMISPAAEPGAVEVDGGDFTE